MPGLPVWIAGAGAALLLMLGVLAVRRIGGGLPTLVSISTLVLGAVAIFVFADRARMHDRMAERRALDDRAAELSARALANAPLACLDGLAGDVVETACERALFARPETVASAVSYVAARFALLADSVEFARTSDPTYADGLVRLRQTLEADRFGILAQVLTSREDCSVARCPALALLREPDRVRTNLKQETFQAYVARYAAEWTTPGGAPVADATPGVAPAGVPASPGSPALAARPLSPQYDFPSAASIPPVSIMNAEPTGTTPPSPPPAQAQPQPQPRRSTPTPPARPAQRPTPRPSQAAAPAASHQSAPPGPPLALPAPGGAAAPD